MQYLHTLTKPFLLSLCFLSPVFLSGKAPILSDVCAEHSDYNAPYPGEDAASLDAYIIGSFTYWQPLEEGLELGLITNSNAFTPTTNGRVIQTEFQYEPGFKTTLHLGGFPDHWSMQIHYLYFRTSTQTAETVSSQSKLYTNRLQEANAAFADSVRSSWKARMEHIDTDIARACYTGQKLLFTPYFGGRLLLFRQTINTTYQGGQITAASNEASQFARSRSWGLGPKTGILSSWRLPLGFSIEGENAFSLLYTRYRVEMEETTTSSEQNRGFSLNQVRYAFRPQYEMRLGGKWSSNWEESYVQIGVCALYEFFVLWHQNMFSSVQVNPITRPSAPLNDFYLQGLTISAQLEF